MLNYNNKSKHYIQNIYKNNIGNIAVKLATRLEKEVISKFEAKSFYR